MNSYAHDEDGITTEDASLVTLMTEKRRKKEAKLKEEMSRYPCVSVRGRSDASTALLCWGSVRNACDEVAARLGLGVIQPVVLWPFPDQHFLPRAGGLNT